jgi:DNA polymerase zeta
MNPAPVKLNFEKVYHPCILQSKKRYVGQKFEAPTEVDGVLDAKGIEMIRRDTCPAVQKMLTRSLELFFSCPDLSAIKAYHQMQYRKILRQEVSVEDFIFSKEVKHGSYALGRLPPPAAIVAQKNEKKDQRNKALYKERVRYVVVYGKPKSKLYDLVVNPADLLDRSKGLRLNSLYYISKQILPALDRCFALVGINVRLWFEEIPQNVRIQSLKLAAAPHSSKHTIDQYYGSSYCRVCDSLIKRTELDPSGLCRACLTQPQKTQLLMDSRRAQLEQAYLLQLQRCRTCAPQAGARELQHPCISLDCSQYYTRLKLWEKLK